MSFRNRNIDSFEVNDFYITVLFSRRNCGCHLDNKSRGCCYVKRKNNPLDILIDYEQLLFPSSICQSTKETQKVMLRFTGIL